MYSATLIGPFARMRSPIRSRRVCTTVLLLLADGQEDLLSIPPDQEHRRTPLGDCLQRAPGRGRRRDRLAGDLEGEVARRQGPPPPAHSALPDEFATAGPRLPVDLDDDTARLDPRLDGGSLLVHAVDQGALP